MALFPPGAFQKHHRDGRPGSQIIVWKGRFAVNLNRCFPRGEFFHYDEVKEAVDVFATETEKGNPSRTHHDGRWTDETTRILAYFIYHALLHHGTYQGVSERYGAPSFVKGSTVDGRPVALWHGFADVTRWDSIGTGKGSRLP